MNALRILIIEDNPADQWLLQDHLEETSLNIEAIVFSETFGGARALLDHQSFSIIFLDLYLPDSNGITALTELAKINSKIPVVLLSGLTDTTISLQAISNGAQDFLIKGEYTAQMLEKAVRYSIERKKNQELIEENNERYDIILKATNDVIFDWNLATDEVKWCGLGLKNYLPDNIPVDNIPGIFWVNGLHPEERKITVAKLHRAISTEGGTWESDNRFRRSDGTFAYVNTRGYVLANGDKKPIRMIGSMQDITDRKTAELEVRQAKFDAEEARKTQEQFLANMSHEIRTPMNGVIGMTQLLAGTGLNEEQLEYVDTIKESAGNLMVIINDILDLTKIVAGKITIDRVNYVFADIVKNAIQITRFKAEEKGILLTWLVDPGINPMLLGDPFRLNQVLVNLLGNAIKFTEHGEVKLEIKKLTEDDETVSLQFSVIDTGIGIDADKLESVFDRFTQASSATTRKFGGSGLGLTITKQLIELQGGSIDVMSTPGIGSTFTFYLSITKGHAEPEAILKNNLLNTEVHQLEGIKILLAEDNLINQKVAVKILTKEGADVTVASNGLEAVELAGNNFFDVILMDIQMPHLDGYNATKAIRNELPLPYSNIPIIAMTASALISEKEKCILAGMNDYITKPFQAKDLFDKIRCNISQHLASAAVSI